MVKGVSFGCHQTPELRSGGIDAWFVFQTGLGSKYTLPKVEQELLPQIRVPKDFKIICIKMVQPEGGLWQGAKILHPVR